MARYQGHRILPWSLWRRILLPLCGIVLLLSCALLGKELVRSRRERTAYTLLSQKVHPLGSPPPLFTEGDTPAPDSQVSPYEALHLENPDFAGWLYIEDTPVDYPVMYTPEEPEYYLRRAFDKTEAVSGCLFIGAGSTPEGVHVILYGHNMRDGSMFGSLSRYAEEAYQQAHPTIRFDTLAQAREYRVLAAFYSHAYLPGEEGFRYYQYTDLTQQEVFEDYVRQAKAASLYDTGVEAVFGQQILTLSTCSYHQKNGTFVVVAVAAEETPSP